MKKQISVHMSSIKKAGILTIIMALLVLVFQVKSFAQTSNSISAVLIPSSNTSPLGIESQLVVDAVINNPDQIDIVSTEITIRFPPELLEVVTLDSSSNPLQTDAITEFDNAQGTISLSKIQIGGVYPKNTTIKTATITFRVKTNTGTADVSFDEVIIYGIPSGTNESVKLTVSSTTNGSYTFSDIPATITITEPVSPTTDPTITINPSVTPTCDESKLSGNYNCDTDENGDAVIDEKDFSDWLSDFISKISDLKFFEFWRRVFFVN